MSSDRKSHMVNPSTVKVGDVMSFTYYVKVKRIVSQEEMVVEDLYNGNAEIGIRGRSLVETAHSADQFSEEEKVSMTKCAEILIASHNRPLTVCFDKADRTERVLRGRLIAPEPLLGRSKCEDLEADPKNRMRLVDHRTIKWLVVDGMKYTVKK